MRAAHRPVCGCADRAQEWVVRQAGGRPRDRKLAAVRGTAPASLTANFEDVPSEHDGSTVFTFRLRFSEDPAVSYEVLRDRAFTVSGGTVKKARRVDGRNDLREIHVQPETTGEIRMDLPATTDCDAVDAICTEDGRPLSHSLSETIASPVGISVADAWVDENGGAPLAFAVTLSRAAAEQVTVDYQTVNGTAGMRVKVRL